MSSIFVYVVDRDFGFAPNPFHGICTLATCKPRIRKAAKIGDWVIGVGGTRLNATGRCIFAMKVTRKIDFNTYWNEVEYRDKRPVRNGGLKMMVGDNIYHSVEGKWNQLDSHHSHLDGTQNDHNVVKDTSADCVLVSDHFYYFGKSSFLIPAGVLSKLGYRNRRNHRRFDEAQATSLIESIAKNSRLNMLMADPFDFDSADARYSAGNNKIIRERPLGNTNVDRDE